ncbi:DUF4236 domain-containing protein [Nocardia nova]|uniref:DUF4236 domain-containing protein n=3 Tax=Nocardia TaxID=1817 RepID=A0A2T2YT55_9NOCA|nr:DUF4236 domain-containing protein [Nocardia nova]
MVRMTRKFGPVRITASKSGFGVSAGAGPVRVTRRADGRVQRTVRLPGTGIYDTKTIGARPNRLPRQQLVSSARTGSPAAAPASRDAEIGIAFFVLVVGGGAAAALASGMIWLAIPLWLVTVFLVYCGLLARSDRRKAEAGRTTARTKASKVRDLPAPTAPPGWYRSPDDPGRQRWWDGQCWAETEADA